MRAPATKNPRQARSESAVLDPERRANTRDIRYSCAAASSESRGARSAGAYRDLPRPHGQDPPIEDRHSAFQMPSLRHYVPWNRFQGQANYLPAQPGHSLARILLNQIAAKPGYVTRPKAHLSVLARYNTGMGSRIYPGICRGRFYRQTGGPA